MPSFDLDAARKSGATDAQIAEYLAEQQGVDLVQMRADRIPDSQIAEFLSQSAAQKPARMSAPMPTATAQPEPVVQQQAKPERSGIANVLGGARHALQGLGIGVRQLNNQLAGIAPMSPLVPIGLFNQSEEMREAKRSNDTSLRGEADRLKAQDTELLNTRGGFWGNIGTKAVVGAGLSLLPPVAPLSNSLLGSAAVGAGLGAMDPAGTGDSRAQNAIMGGAGGAAGYGLGRLIGSVVAPGARSMTPERAENVLRVRAENPRQPIPLDVGQATGSTAHKWTTAVAESMPGMAGPRQQFTQAQRASVNNAVSRYLGQDVQAITPKVLREVHASTKIIFDQVKASNRPVNLNVRSVKNTLDEIVDRQTNMLTTGAIDPDLLSAAQQLLQHASRNNGRVNAAAARDTASRYLAKARESTDYEVRAGYTAIANALDDAVANSLPKNLRKSFDDARGKYAVLAMLRDTPGVLDTEGNVSVNALAQMLANNQRSAWQKGEGDLIEFARAVRGTVGDTAKSSGTSERTLGQKVFTGAGHAVGNLATPGVATAAALSAGVVPAAIAAGTTLAAGRGYLGLAQSPQVLSRLERIATSKVLGQAQYPASLTAAQNALVAGSAQALPSLPMWKERGVEAERAVNALRR
jgi:hypothetical protein